MTEQKNTTSYTPPNGKVTTETFFGQRFEVNAGWTLLRKKEKPLAEIFSMSYVQKQTRREKRPVTFVFNGGPGAGSAFLHVGALGPRRVVFGEKGELPGSPIRLESNRESWLPFTDLVFVDPVGTGLSRVIEEEPTPNSGGGQSAGPSRDPNEFYKIQRDIDSLGEFIELYLSKNKRWGSPVYLAGESYGGFRVGKLARRLQERFGVALKGAFLISPALELAAIDYTDYNLVPYVNVFPALAATAWYHKRVSSRLSLSSLCEKAETFAKRVLPRALIEGASLDRAVARDTRKEMSVLCGLSEELIEKLNFRVSPWRFQNELLRDEQRHVGAYDGALTSKDPFPGREIYHGPDATFQGISRVFMSGINITLRDLLGLEIERPYELLSEEVYVNWKADLGHSLLQTEIGSTDDLRYALELNEDLKVVVVHGCYDLVTPYFSSLRVLSGCHMSPHARSRLSFENYEGGHMFYSWAASRKQFASSAAKLYGSKS